MILSLINQLEFEFEKNRNDNEAEGMSLYMKNKFSYLGIKKPTRANIQKDWFTKIPTNLLREQKWELVYELWQKEHREFHYVAMDYLRRWKDKEINFDDAEQIEFLLTNHTWWDSVDTLASNYLSRYMRLFPVKRDLLIEKWRESENMWLRRSCLIFQLRYKEDTNFELMKDLICQFKSEKEFFIQKAIGWCLREYAKTQPVLVKDFVDESGIKGLAKREALKYILKN